MPEEMNRTKKALDGALRQLLGQKPLAQIRVREVTELCAIRRQSFYDRFTDVGQLFDWSLARERAYLPTRQEKCLTWQQAAADLLAYTAESRSFYLAILEDATEQFLKAALSYCRERSGVPPDPEAEHVRVLWWQTLLLTLIEDWLRGDLCQPPEEVISLLERDLRDGMTGAAWRSLSQSGTIE